MATLRIRTFARYAELLGDPVELDLPFPASVADLIIAVRALPHGKSLPATLLVAVDQAIAPPGLLLSGEEDIALLPPLAGG